MKRAARGVVPCLIDAERRKVDSLHGRRLELVHVRRLEGAVPGVAHADLGHHHAGAALPARIRLVEAEPPPEHLVAVAEEPGVVLPLGRRAQPRHRGVIAELARHHQPGLRRADLDAGVVPPQGVRGRLVQESGQLAILRQQQEGGPDAGAGAAVGLVVDDGVVVAGDPFQPAVAADAEEVLAGVLQPAFHRPVRRAAVDAAVQVHAEPGGGVAREPDLGVLALRSFGPLAILPFEKFGDAVLVPLEDLVAVTGDLERPLVLVVAGDVAVDAQDQVEPAPEEQVALRADRIGGESPRLDAVRGPPDAVVVAAEPLGDHPHDVRRVVRPARVVADLRQPVDGAPVGRIAAGESVGDPRVDLAPRRRLVGHEQQGVRGVVQVEAAVAGDHRVRVAVPPHVRDAVGAPVVRGGRLLPQEAQPAARPPVEGGMDRPGRSGRKLRCRLARLRHAGRRKGHRAGGGADTFDEAAPRVFRGHGSLQHGEFDRARPMQA